MPRRPKGKGHSKKPRPLNHEDGKVHRWNKLSDIPLDEEDQFHVNRDRILLNGEDPDVNDEGDEDEVFALNGIPASSSDEEQEADEAHQPTTSRKKQKAKGKKAPAPPTSDDTEHDNTYESEEEETWGSKKSVYYSTNAAHFDSEDGEANELEEQEAKRLQIKTRDVLTDDDFGLADHVEAIQNDIQDLIEPEPQVLQAFPQDKQSILRHLEKTSPETLALARDWDDIARSVVRAGEKLKKMESEAPDAMCLGMVHLHYQTLLTYATTLAFYLHLRASTKYATNPDLLKTHPILDRLLTLKHSLATLEDLDFDMSDDQPEGDSDDDDEDLDLDLDGIIASRDCLIQPRRSGRKKNMLELNELQELLKDAAGDLDISDPPASGPQKRKSKKSKASEDEPPKKKRKTGGDVNEPSQRVFDLVEPEFEYSTNPKITSTNWEAAGSDVYGEQMTLQPIDAADKKARKRSLRFHTAKIDSAAGRRERGVKNAMGGDDDIPYKERRKQKEAREAKELAKTSRGEGGDDLSDAEPDAASEGVQSKRKRAEESNNREDSSGDEGDADGYYSLVEKKVKARKEQKKAEYDAARAAEKQGLMSIDTSDGPRRLTDAILKNRGLTPHRSKSVRNPRVKKRMKFDKAKKKVSSQKAVYKGGVGDSGRYDGEKSGISKVVKAVKL